MTLKRLQCVSSYGQLWQEKSKSSATIFFTILLGVLLSGEIMDLRGFTILLYHL